MENFGKFITIMLAMLISPIINGFVIAKLWLWFIVPTFEANPLRIVEAIGLMFLINYIKAKRSKKTDNYDFWEEFTGNMVFLILMSGFSLLIGWITQMFM
jgi:hypothetical protein